MMRSRFIQHFIQRGALLAALIGASAAVAVAQSAEDLRMTVGKSVVIDYPSDIRQISTSNPEILDASPVTTREILLHGKGLGNATHDRVEQVAASGRSITSRWTRIVDPLRRLLKESFPNEDIQVRTSRDSISLNGHVSNKDVRSAAMVAGDSVRQDDRAELSDRDTRWWRSRSCCASSSPRSTAPRNCNTASTCWACRG